MAYTTQYIGSRYVPIFADPAEWNSARTYEPLTIVLNKGNSYISRQFVPVGVALTNTNYWLETGNYNAQVEAYRQEVLNYIAKTNIATFKTLDDAIEKINYLENGDFCFIISRNEQQINSLWQITNNSANTFDNVFADNQKTLTLIYPLTDCAALGITATNASDCIQKAISNTNENCKTVFIPSGNYTITNNIQSYTDVAIKSYNGDVSFNVTANIGFNISGFKFDTTPFRKYHTIFQGDFKFIGDSNRNKAIQLGSASTYTNRFTLENCNFEFFETAITLYMHNLYIININKCAFEFNTTAIDLTNGDGDNAGERITINQCVFGNNIIGTKQSMASDIYITNSSLDFNQIPVQLTAGKAIITNSHIEGNGAIKNSNYPNAPIGVVQSSGYLRVYNNYIYNSVSLPIPIKNTTNNVSEYGFFEIKNNSIGYNYALSKENNVNQNAVINYHNGIYSENENGGNAFYPPAKNTYLPQTNKDTITPDPYNNYIIEGSNTATGTYVNINTSGTLSSAFNDNLNQRVYTFTPDDSNATYNIGFVVKCQDGLYNAFYISHIIEKNTRLTDIHLSPNNVYSSAAFDYDGIEIDNFIISRNWLTFLNVLLKDTNYVARINNLSGKHSFCMPRLIYFN